MNFTRKQFLAVLAGLSLIPGKLLALPLNFFSNRTKPNRSPLPPTRTGPWLGDWRQCQWVPLNESVHPTAQRLIRAARRHEMLAMRYWGGSTPGAARIVSPGLVFQAGGCGPLFVSGYCHLRRQERVFRVERVELLTGEGDPICITE
jgi:predicted DNA-binding transcriptional regulator YafY